MNEPLGHAKLWRLLRAFGLVAGVAFMAWLLSRLLSDPHFTLDRLAPGGFIAAIAVGVVANAGVSIAFSEMIGKIAPDTTSTKRLTAFYYAQIAKYIPGRIAALMVQRSVLSGQFATMATITSNLELMIFSSLLGAGAAASMLAWPFAKTLSIALALAAITLGAFTLRVDSWGIVRFAAKVVPSFRGGFEHLRAIARIGRWRATLLSSVVFALPAASSYCLLVSGLGIDQDVAIQLCALLLLSWIGGLLAFVFPAGLGIREFLFVALGSAIGHAPDATAMAVIALASRVTQVMIDITGVFLFATGKWAVFAVRGACGSR